MAWLEAYLDECVEAGKDIAGQEWVMDKGFVSQPLKDRGEGELLNVTLLARQRDYKNKPADFWQRLLDRLRKPIEGVISVLTEGFERRASACAKRHRPVSPHPSQSDGVFAGPLF